MAGSTVRLEFCLDNARKVGLDARQLDLWVGNSSGNSSSSSSIRSRNSTLSGVVTLGGALVGARSLWVLCCCWRHRKLKSLVCRTNTGAEDGLCNRFDADADADARLTRFARGRRILPLNLQTGARMGMENAAGAMRIHVKARAR